jgi:hypothetical protein
MKLKKCCYICENIYYIASEDFDSDFKAVIHICDKEHEILDEFESKCDDFIIEEKIIRG